MKNITNLLYNVLVSMFIFVISASFVPTEQAIWPAIGLFCLSLIPRKRVHGAYDEVMTTIFSDDLQEMLYPNNSFYTGADFDEGVAVSAKTVEVPLDEIDDVQYVKNPKRFPLDVQMTEDQKVTYNVDLLATLPHAVTDLNQMVVSYDKRAAKLRKHANQLNTQVASSILRAWQPTDANYKKKTTGKDQSTDAGTKVRTGHAKGATGNRKRIGKQDVFWAFSMFNDLDIPEEGRRLVIPAYMYEDLFMIDDFIDADKLRASGRLNSGQIGEILGFSVYTRSLVPSYNNATPPIIKAENALAASTDNQSALFFHPDFVRYAKGDVQVYIDEGRGDYLGDIMNAAIRSGGMLNRLSQKGVALLVEDNE